VSGPPSPSKVSARKLIYSGGAQSIANAPQWELQLGEQSFNFVLPAELQPVLTQFEWIGARPEMTPTLNARLYTGAAPGAIAEPSYLNVQASQLWSLPGQTIELSLCQYRLIDGQTTTWTVRPRISTTQVLHIEPMVLR
jgi:hypothetical protein